MGTKVNHMVSAGFDVAKEVIATQTESDDFVANLIFWLVKVSEAKVAVSNSAFEDIRMCRHCPPINNWISLRVKGVVSDALLVYSPGRRRKKNAMMIISMMHFVISQVECSEINANR